MSESRPAPQDDAGSTQPKRPFPPGVSPTSGFAPPVEHRWKKGQSGNPGGRPKGQSITAALRALLAQEHNGKLLAQLIAERMVKEALSGKFPHLKELLERAEGKVTERHEVETEQKIVRVEIL